MSKVPGKTRKLKVFQAQIGFHDMVVAVPSKAAALRAWDVRQDLFAEGLAAAVTDAKTVEAALAHPGIPLLRPAGTDKPFALKPGRLPAPPKEKAPPKAPSGGKAAKKAAGRPAPKPQPKPKPDRAKLDAAEAALDRLARRREEQEAAFAREEEKVRARRDAMRAASRSDQEAARAALAKARRAYRKAGGVLD